MQRVYFGLFPNEHAGVVISDWKAGQSVLEAVKLELRRREHACWTVSAAVLNNPLFITPHSTVLLEKAVK